MAEYEAKGDKYTWVVSSWDAGLSIYCVFIKKSFNLQRLHLSVIQLKL